MRLDMRFVASGRFLNLRHHIFASGTRLLHSPWNIISNHICEQVGSQYMSERIITESRCRKADSQTGLALRDGRLEKRKVETVGTDHPALYRIQRRRGLLGTASS